MFYRPQDGHTLPHNPFNAIVSPRPIGWISSRSADGTDNLAPYSFFNAVAYVPPQVMFSSAGRKDSLNNIESTGVFAVNLVGAPMADVMNKSSQAVAHDVDEFAHAGISKLECETIACARVADAPATLECKVTQIIRLAGIDNHAVFGEVTGVHMREDCIVDGRFDVVTAQLLSRLGYRDYAQVTKLFELKRPDD
ncbi:flavin reductase family protein [Pacificibacter marinus]|uniref:Flavin reductase like domain protein n=1 Tax=Pacificibacter marinus TaxID=658057 RepID=A0A1Y5RLH3_9RHOB|nr:flavin reductase family protein [Pacificibacter marinus]SEK18953.1 NADH-FMN oxidoreductase RutF, flavin reductase (DIM6/NTAB) family [Pacificibacter marinus]SLN17517.1 Flavin reductase like domain protein [Pacificibacter marinus]